MFVTVRYPVRYQQKGSDMDNIDANNPNAVTAFSNKSDGRSSWQSIETAPKDGTHILAFIPERELDLIYVVKWLSGRANHWEEADGEQFAIYDPTHWMPLPEPPNP